MQIVQNIAYIVWKANSNLFNIPLGTDTFVVDDEKILYQSVAGVIQPL